MPLSDLWKPLFAVLIIASLSACLAAHSWWLSALLFSLLGIECFIFPEDLLGFGKQFWGHRYNKHLFMLLIIALLSAYLAPHCWWLGALLLLLWLVIEGFIFWKNLWVPVSWKFFSCDEFLYGLLLLVLLIALVDRINDFGWFKHLEATFFDSFSRTRNHTMNAPIFIVEITDGDYTNFFCGKSPLKPGPMLTR